MDIYSRGVPTMRKDTTDESAGSSRPTSAAAHADEDFLYHLYRGTELLVQDRVVEAKGELEQALALQPQDAKGQDLLAGVYFRLGVYPRSIEIWSRLVGAYPRDATLRVNLALALLKTGQPAVAAEHLRVGVQVDPEHRRAWGYLGLTHWRLGRFVEARDAFVQGGQMHMARRMEDAMGSATSVPDRLPSDPVLREKIRSLMDQAIERFESEQISIHPAISGRAPGAWTVAEPGSEHHPSVRPLSALPEAIHATAFDPALHAWRAALPAGVDLAVGPNGSLFLDCDSQVYSRSVALRAVGGELRTTPVHRRVRGRELETLLGGDRPILRWHGPVSAVLWPPAGARFVALHLQDDLLFVREDALRAFERGLGFESGGIETPGEPLPIVQLHGSGTLILAVSGVPVALATKEGTEVCVSPEALVGWTGRLLPNRRQGTEPYSATAPPLNFRGDGTVLVL